MEGVKLIESLETVWFFSNVLSSKSQALGFHGKEDHMIKAQVKSSPILETQIPIAEIVVPKCGGDLTCEIVESKSRDKEERERSKSRKRRVLKNITGSYQRRSDNVNVDNEKKGYDFDFNFDVSEIWMMEEGYQRFTTQNHAKMLPPIRDGMAMKQHLKSWAYVVACNVR